MQMPRSLLVVGLVAMMALGMLGSAQAQVGARALAMGGAFVGLADDVSATYWNPAALCFLPDSGGTYSGALNNRDGAPCTDFAAYVAPFDETSTIGVSYARGVVEAVSAYDYSLDWTQSMWWVSYSYRASNNTGVGFNVRWINDDIDATELGIPVTVSVDTDLGIDVAAYHVVSDRVTVGLMVTNVNEPEVRVGFPEAPEMEGKLSREYTPGVAMRFPEQGLIVVADLHDATDVVEAGIRVGAEKAFPRGAYTLALRAGYEGNASAVTVGGGIHYGDWTVDIAVLGGDYENTCYVSATSCF
jgi:hypothetical protein